MSLCLGAGQFKKYNQQRLVAVMKLGASTITTFSFSGKQNLIYSRTLLAYFCDETIPFNLFIYPKCPKLQ